MTVERICRKDGKDVIFLKKDIFGEEEIIVSCGCSKEKGLKKEPKTDALEEKSK